MLSMFVAMRIGHEAQGYRDEMRVSARMLAGVHAAYFVSSGVWPLIHRPSFEQVTGKKEDFWLVRTVGGLAAASGLSMGLAAWRGSRQPETVVLALANGLVFALADLRAARTESRLYLADSLLQIGFASAWLASWK
jgi:hypothetical protein